MNQLPSTRSRPIYLNKKDLSTGPARSSPPAANAGADRPRARRVRTTIPRTTVPRTATTMGGKLKASRSQRAGRSLGWYDSGLGPAAAHPASQKPKYARLVSWRG